MRTTLARLAATVTASAAGSPVNSARSSALTPVGPSEVSRLFSPKELQRSQNMFLNQPTRHVFSVFSENTLLKRSAPHHQTTPEVVFVANASKAAGKASLISALFGRQVWSTDKCSAVMQTSAVHFLQMGTAPGTNITAGANQSKDKDRKKSQNEAGKVVNEKDKKSAFVPSLTIVDFPDSTRRSSKEWSSYFNEYLRARRHLKRIYLLVNAHVGKLGALDIQLLKLLSEFGEEEAVRQTDKHQRTQILGKREFIGPHGTHSVAPGANTDISEQLNLPVVQIVLTKIDAAILSALQKQGKSVETASQEEKDAVCNRIATRVFNEVVAYNNRGWFLSDHVIGVSIKSRTGLNDLRASIVHACELVPTTAGFVTKAQAAAAVSSNPKKSGKSAKSAATKSAAKENNDDDRELEEKDSDN
ncbi:hypothetical protein GQ42DRAFT_162349 [Ramicandelaber brevisporus]|nr:hypothetical protein GQ42DRAFT_162349 [Ramicandelaber brevisporus]